MGSAKRASSLATTIALLLGLVLTPVTAAQEYSPGVGADFPKDVFFGDLHLHSRNSADAFSMGNTGLTAADAFRFARGEEVIASNGRKVRLKRPLDFLAVTDHAEFLGFFYLFHLKHPKFMETGLAKRWTELAKTEAGHYRAFANSINDPDPERDAAPESLKRSVWRDVTRTADDYDHPGVFTAFSGYEWTSMTGGNNLHRCIIFKDGSNTVSQLLPFSAQQSVDPEDLWNALKTYETQTGGRVLSIPHNGNLSNGLMWDTQTLSGRRISAEYARTRMRWEPIAEVTQVKGDSETHPILSPNDEFADFERWDQYNIMNTVKTTPEMLPGSYARSALQRGLALERKMGANPFKFGMIGSTDDHTGLATAAEDNFFGKFANSEPGERSPDTHMATGLMADWDLGASGLAAVWAQENTRAELFDAMERKEVYATTGSRIVLRFFGSWNFAPGTINAPDFVKQGYANGVPMGGDLSRSKDHNQAPEFLVYALKDPEDANLDRVQIIKGWLDTKGQQQEKIYDVALAGGRTEDPKTGKAPSIGSTVNVEMATYENSIGAAQLTAQWRDPEFDPNQRAFYYARVLEIPKPRWTTKDRKHFGLATREGTPTSVVDRAYSSPIWYTP